MFWHLTVKQEICWSECYLKILRTAHLIYFTLGRFVAEHLRNCSVAFGVNLDRGCIQYEYILNTALCDSGAVTSARLCEEFPIKILERLYTIMTVVSAED